MSNRSIRRQAGTEGVLARPNAAHIRQDSDDDLLYVTTGASGTTEVALVDVSSTQTLTNKTLTSPAVTGLTGSLTGPTMTAPLRTTETVTAVGASLTLTAAVHGGTTLLLDSAAGSEGTLPAATGSGVKFRFFASVAITSSAHLITVVGDDEFVGAVFAVSTTGGAADCFPATPGSDNDQISMDGDLEGGEYGSWIEVQDIAADTWSIWGVLHVVGATPVTPFLTGQVS